MLHRLAALCLLTLTCLAGAALAQGTGGGANAPPAPPAVPGVVEKKGTDILKSGVDDKADQGGKTGAPAPAKPEQPVVKKKEPVANPGPGPRQQVVQYLAEAKSRMTKRGFAQCRASWLEKLPDSRAATKTYRLPANTACEVAARCDNDCNDIDIWVASPKGVVIGEAVGTTDEEHLAFVAKASGNYVLKTQMPGCRNKGGCVGGVLLCCQR